MCVKPRGYATPSSQVSAIEEKCVVSSTRLETFPLTILGQVSVVYAMLSNEAHVIVERHVASAMISLLRATRPCTTQSHDNRRRALIFAPLDLLLYKCILTALENFGSAMKPLKEHPQKFCLSKIPLVYVEVDFNYINEIPMPSNVIIFSLNKSTCTLQKCSIMMW